VKSINCPHCEGTWEIADDAPAPRTCPLCLLAMTRPAQPHSALLRVLPLDEQVAADQKVGRGALIVLLVAIGTGLFLLFYEGVTGAREQTILLLGTLLVVVGGVFSAMVAVGSKSQPEPIVEWKPLQEEPVAPVEQEPGGHPVLYYRAASTRGNDAGAGEMVAQAVGGAIAGIIGMFMLASSGTPMSFVVIVPCVGFALVFSRKVRGLGIGLILAIPIVMLIIMGLCSGFRM